MKKAKELARAVFKEHSELTEVFVLEDDNVFSDQGAAIKHCTNKGFDPENVLRFDRNLNVTTVKGKLEEEAEIRDQAEQLKAGQDELAQEKEDFIKEKEAFEKEKEQLEADKSQLKLDQEQLAKDRAELKTEK